MLPEEPTSDEHCAEMLQKLNLPIPERLPGYTTGPFVTKRAAQWVADNPRCTFNSIAEAERMVQRELDQAMLCQDYGNHLKAETARKRRQS
jgi:hypothetical protein